MSGMYSVIDGLFIGKSTGDVGLAAINIAWPINAVITAVGIGIGMGGSILFSHQKGKEEESECQRIFQLTNMTLVFFGVVLTGILFFLKNFLLHLLGARGEILEQANSYSRIVILGSLFQVVGAGIIPILRNVGLPVIAMLSMIAGMIVNLVANYLMIFHFNLGIQGAAYGTVLAQFVVMLISIGCLIKKVSYKFNFFWDGTLIIKIIRSGCSAFGLSIAPSIALMYTNLQCLKYGGEEAVACYAVISYIVFPVQSMLAGIGEGIQPLMSYYCGANSKEELAYVRKVGNVLIGILGCFSMLLVCITAKHISVWFGLSKLASDYFYAGMLISAVSFLMVGFTKMNVCYMNACLKIRSAMNLVYGEIGLVTPCLLYLLPKVFGLQGVWMALPSTSLVMIILYCLLIERKS